MKRAESRFGNQGRLEGEVNKRRLYFLNKADLSCALLQGGLYWQEFTFICSARTNKFEITERVEVHPIRTGEGVILSENRAELMKGFVCD